MANIKSFPNNRDEYVGAEYAMRWLHGRTSGVFAANNNAAVAAVQNAMAVTVSDGVGWISNSDANGVVWWNDAEKTNGAKMQLTIDAADGVLNRIDRVIVEWKTTDYADLPEIKILKGTPASTAVAPSLTNNTTQRQLSLAQILVSAGTTSITASMITDERQNPDVCGLVTDTLSIDTSVINAQFTELLEQLRSAIEQVESGQIADGSVTAQKLAADAVKLSFSNTIVSDASFVADSTYADFQYRAFVPLTGVTSSMTPEVVFGVTEAVSGTFAPVAETYNGGEYIYTSEVPISAITIPTIRCWR